MKAIKFLAAVFYQRFNGIRTTMALARLRRRDNRRARLERDSLQAENEGLREKIQSLQREVFETQSDLAVRNGESAVLMAQLKMHIEWQRVELIRLEAEAAIHATRKATAVARINPMDERD